MRKLNSFLLLTLLLSVTAMAQQPAIVDANWLAERLDDQDLVVLHVSGEEDYKEGHIPGARFVFFDSYTYSSGMTPTDQVYDLPELSKLDSLLEATGIKKNSKIVVYPGATSHLPVTRLLFTFHYLGWDQVSILSGGKSAWKAAGKELVTTEPSFSTSTLNLKPNKQLVVSKADVAKALKTDVKIVDCRAEAYYTGVDVNQYHGGRKGHIPGAKTIPYTSLFEKTDAGFYQFLTEDQLASIFEKQGLRKDDDIILYCHIGLQLTSVFTVAKQLGYTNVRVFDGSFHEWGPDESLPVSLD